MLRQAKSDLLKEYINTLVPAEMMFPSIQPRGWGEEFSRAELQAIYTNLKFLLKTASPQPRKVLLEEFRRIDDPTVNMHWFLCSFWSEIAELLVKPVSYMPQYELMAQ